ncbi:MAG: hypothetical protein AAGA91_02665 [Pseudomonadota bacterium]
MKTLLLVIVVLIFGAAGLMLRGNKRPRLQAPRKAKGDARASIKQASRWRATSILYGEEACTAVKVLSRSRFLDSEKRTPMLPLPDCDAAQCDCRYAHHEDRRDSDFDRRLTNMKTRLYADASEERRSDSRGRRDSDWDEPGF